MERVTFLIEDSGEQLSCMLNPERVVLRRSSGLVRQRSLGAELDGATDDLVLRTGGGSTEVELDLLFDLSLGAVDAAVPAEDVRELTSALWRLTERSESGCRAATARLIWGRCWNMRVVVDAIAERLEEFSPVGAARRSWLRVRLLRIDEEPPRSLEDVQEALPVVEGEALPGAAGDELAPTDEGLAGEGDVEVVGVEALQERAALDSGLWALVAELQREGEGDAALEGVAAGEASAEGDEGGSDPGVDAVGDDAMGEDAMGEDAIGDDASGVDAMSEDAIGGDAIGEGDAAASAAENATGTDATDPDPDPADGDTGEPGDAAADGVRSGPRESAAEVGQGTRGRVDEEAEDAARIAEAAGAGSAGVAASRGAEPRAATRSQNPGEEIGAPAASAAAVDIAMTLRFAEPRAVATCVLVVIGQAYAEEARLVSVPRAGAAPGVARSPAAPAGLDAAGTAMAAPAGAPAPAPSLPSAPAVAAPAATRAADMRAADMRAAPPPAVTPAASMPGARPPAAAPAASVAPAPVAPAAPAPAARPPAAAPAASVARPQAAAASVAPAPIAPPGPTPQTRPATPERVAPVAVAPVAVASGSVPAVSAPAASAPAAVASGAAAPAAAPVPAAAAATAAPTRGPSAPAAPVPDQREPPPPSTAASPASPATTVASAPMTPPAQTAVAVPTAPAPTAPAPTLALSAAPRPAPAVPAAPVVPAARARTAPAPRAPTTPAASSPEQVAPAPMAPSSRGSRPAAAVPDASAPARPARRARSRAERAPVCRRLIASEREIWEGLRRYAERLEHLAVDSVESARLSLQRALRAAQRLGSDDLSVLETWVSVLCASEDPILFERPDRELDELRHAVARLWAQGERERARRLAACLTQLDRCEQQMRAALRALEEDPTLVLWRDACHALSAPGLRAASGAAPALPAAVETRPQVAVYKLTRLDGELPHNLRALIHVFLDGQAAPEAQRSACAAACELSRREYDRRLRSRRRSVFDPRTLDAARLRTRRLDLVAEQRFGNPGQWRRLAQARADGEREPA